MYDACRAELRLAGSNCEVECTTSCACGGYCWNPSELPRVSQVIRLQEFWSIGVRTHSPIKAHTLLGEYIGEGDIFVILFGSYTFLNRNVNSAVTDSAGVGSGLSRQAYVIELDKIPRFGHLYLDARRQRNWAPSMNSSHRPNCRLITVSSFIIVRIRIIHFYDNFRCFADSGRKRRLVQSGSAIYAGHN